MLDDSTKRQGPTSLSSLSPSILHLDPHFIVIDKPYDVRMDGNHPVTVEKLLYHWNKENQFTIPSLPDGISKRDNKENLSPSFKWVHQLDFATSGALCVALTKDGAAAACNSFEQRKVKKQYLAVLYGHLNVKDLTQFEKKDDIINIYVEDSTQTNSTALSSSTKLVSSIAGSNNSYYSKRKEEQRTLNKNFQSNDTWQNELMLENLKLAYNSLQNLIKKYPTEEDFKLFIKENIEKYEENLEINENLDKNDELNEDNNKKRRKFQQEKDESTSLLNDYILFKSITFEALSINNKQRKLLRKFLNKCNETVETIQEEQFKKEYFEQKIKENLEKCEDNDNEDFNSSSSSSTFFQPPLPLDDLQIESLLDFYRNQSEIKKDSPHIYRIPYSASSIYSSDEINKKDEDNELLIIDIPLADYDTNEFKVIPGLPEEYREDYYKFILSKNEKYKKLLSSNSTISSLFSSLYYPEGRRSLTKLEVLSHGYFEGKIPVTKVLLTPLTGRRHQLRLHCRSIGFPILNDFTYNKIQQENDDYSSKRMMLHSYRLIIYPYTKISNGLKEYLLYNEDLEKKNNEKEEEIIEDKKKKKRDINLEKPLVKVQTKDPFIFEGDQLII